MTEITVIARVISVMCLGGNIVLLWYAKRRGWREVYFVWLLAFGVFNVILQWATGLAWWLALVSVSICTVAMIIAMVRGLLRLQRQQAMFNMEMATIHAERQRVLDDIARQHRELMQLWEAAQIGEGGSDDH